jgi:hypothetical protein
MWTNYDSGDGHMLPDLISLRLWCRTYKCVYYPYARSPTQPHL